MALAGGVGADVSTTAGPSDLAGLFAESTTRFVVEVRHGDVGAFDAALSGIPFTKLGRTVKEPRLRIAGTSGEWIVWATLDQLREAWQAPMRW
jgi:phosphoribosylformylglycinamidine synthase